MRDLRHRTMGLWKRPRVVGRNRNDNGASGEEKMMKTWRSIRVEHPPFGAQAGLARAALGGMGLGALAVGAAAVGALAIGALAIGRLAVRRGRIRHLEIGELEVGRLRVRELIVEQEQTPERGAS